ncbi:MAG: hypothetical protein VKL02_01335, partial [Cylindrospermopsis raciborskii 1523720]
MNKYTTTLNHIFGKIPLKTLLSIFYLTPIITCVGIVSYISYHTAEESVNDLTNKLMMSTTEQIEDHIRTHLETPQRIVGINRDGIQNSYLNPENWEALRLYFFNQVKIYKEATAIYFGGINGTHMLAAQDK